MRGIRIVALFTVVVALAGTDLDLAGAAEHRRRPPSPARIESFDLPSPLIDTSVPGGRLQRGRTVPKVNVLLPKGYDDHPRRRYPVLWMLHGANNGADSWLNGFTAMAEDLGAVVVMPDGGVFGMYTDWWNGGARANPSWATYHLEELRKTIEERYRLRPERRWHTVLGISMGGQGALRYAAMLPGYFGTVVGLSAALPDIPSFEMQLGVQVASTGHPGTSYEAAFGPADGPYADGVSPLSLAAAYADTRMYLSSGNGTNCPEDPQGPTYELDGVTELFINQQQGRFADAARAAGADVTAVTTCGVHTFGIWDRAFVDVREWGFFEPVPERPREWVYRTIATSGEMWGLRYRFTEPPTEVASFRRADGWLGALGSGKVVIEGGRGCRLVVELPFVQRLPRTCRR